MKIAFLGLGNMGLPIARNLLNAGHDLTVWNRSGDKADAIVAEGARRAAHPADAAAGVEIVMTMLADDRAVETVAFGADGFLAAGTEALHVSLSTISLALADRLVGAHSATLSAPVFGRPPAAEAGELFVAVAGAAGLIARAQPLFDAIGQRTFVVGERPSQANVVKLCGNFAIMAAIETMGETMALAAKHGIAPAALLEVMTGTIFGAPVYRNYGAMIVEGRYRPAGFPAPLGLKDMRLVGDAAADARVPMPVLGVVRDRLATTIAREGDDIDWSAIARLAATDAGL